MALNEQEFAAETERNEGLKTKIKEEEAQLQEADAVPVDKRTTEFNAQRSRLVQSLEQNRRELEASNGRLLVPSNAETPLGSASGTVTEQTPRLIPDESDKTGDTMRMETAKEVDDRIKGVTAEKEGKGSNVPPRTGPPLPGRTTTVVSNVETKPPAPPSPPASGTTLP